VNAFYANRYAPSLRERAFDYFILVQLFALLIGESLGCLLAVIYWITQP
jgi:hypothetical protein